MTGALHDLWCGSGGGGSGIGSGSGSSSKFIERIELTRCL